MPRPGERIEIEPDSRFSFSGVITIHGYMREGGTGKPKVVFQLGLCTRGVNWTVSVRKT